MFSSFPFFHEKGVKVMAMTGFSKEEQHTLASKALVVIGDAR